MDFSLSDEQQLIIKTTRDFVENELIPHEKEIEETGVLREELHRELKARRSTRAVCRQHAGGRRGGGLDTVAWSVREGTGRTAMRCIGPASAGRQHPSGLRGNSASDISCPRCAARRRNAWR